MSSCSLQCRELCRNSDTVIYGVNISKAKNKKTIAFSTGNVEHPPIHYYITMILSPTLCVEVDRMSSRMNYCTEN